MGINSLDSKIELPLELTPLPHLFPINGNYSYIYIYI